MNSGLFLRTSAPRRAWAQRLLALKSRDEAKSVARELAEKQFHDNPVLRRVWKSPETCSAVSQRVFKECDVFCGDPGEARIVFHSSGTTLGRPSRHYLRDGLIYRSVNVEGARRAGLLKPGVELHFLSSTPREAPHSSLSRMFSDWVHYGEKQAERFWVKDGEVQAGALRVALERAIRAKQPVGLAGTAFAFVHWLDAFPGERLQLPEGSWLMETGGFKGRSRELSKPDLYRELRHAFGVSDRNIWNEYGMTELCSQAYARGTRGEHHTPPWAWVRVVRPEDGREAAVGESGLVEWIDLANTDSVLAVRTQDAAVRLERGFRLIGRVTDHEARGCSLSAETWRHS